MSDGEHRKRNQFFKLLGLRLRSLKASPHSRGTGESSTHTPTTAPFTTPVARGVAGLNKTTLSISSAQYLVSPTEPPLKPQPGGAIGDVTTSQPGPTPATAAATDATHTQVENEGEQPTSTAAGSIQAESLWSRAFISDGLSSQERKTLTDISFEVDSGEMASAVSSVTDEILNKKKGRLWKVRIRGEEVVLRDVGIKILRWVDKFKQIGDIIVQYDPGHAALPWAGFRFLLQVGFNH